MNKHKNTLVQNQTKHTHARTTKKKIKNTTTLAPHTNVHNTQQQWRINENKTQAKKKNQKYTHNKKKKKKKFFQIIPKKKIKKTPPPPEKNFPGKQKANNSL